MPALPPAPDLAQYGYFDEADACFVLIGPPPRKWWNLHCNRITPDGDEIYAEVSNQGDGQTWVRDAEGTTVVLHNYDAKYYYVRDESTGAVFCPGGGPAPGEVTELTTRYYREKTVISSVSGALRATQRVFVPREHPIEVTTVTVENLSDQPREVSVFGYVMFALHGFDKEGRWVDNEKFAVVHPEIGGVLCTNRNTRVPNDRFKAYLLALEGFVNGNGYRDHFTRYEFSLGTPRILWGWNCDGRPGYGYDCAATVQVKLHLPAHGTARADFLFGQTRSLEETIALRARFNPALLDRLCDEARDVEAHRAEAFRIDIGSPHYNGLFNIFLKKQLYCYLINKSGFRDNLQVDYPLAMADYAAAEDNLLRALASQKPSGSVPHSFRPLNRAQYSDKPAWILMTVPGLVKESGDFSLLDKVVPYFESSESGTVYDHLLRAMRFLCRDLGKHGFCDQHHADWNDGLEATAESGARESIMVTQQLCYGLREVAELAHRRGDDKVAREAQERYREFADRLNEKAWMGQWYARTFCEDGYIIGSPANKEGRIFVNTQSWAILSGTAPVDRAQTCMRMVDELLEVDLGFRICTPAFAQYDPRVGRMSNSMPGANENGGCYNHAAGFKGVADCLLGRAEEAWRTFVKVTPNSPFNPVARSGAEPFSFVNSYSTVPYIYGQSGYAWRTGTSGWMATLLIEYILGARRHYDGLEIAPCLTREIPRARLVRHFRGTRFDIQIDNTAGRQTGVRELWVDGRQVEQRILAPAPGETRHVRVVI